MRPQNSTCFAEVPATKSATPSMSSSQLYVRVRLLNIQVKEPLAAHMEYARHKSHMCSKALFGFGEPETAWVQICNVVAICYTHQHLLTPPSRHVTATTHWKCIAPYTLTHIKLTSFACAVFCPLTLSSYSVARLNTRIGRIKRRGSR
jgi:hypothetical protein